MAPPSGGETPAGAVERLVKQEQWVVGACLMLIAGLAWAWLGVSAARMDASMAAMADMPGMTMGAMPPPLAVDLGAAVLMWLLMMTAMMLPSAAPMILLYARFTRQARGQGAKVASTAAFAGVYLMVWALFSFVAASAQVFLVRWGLVDAMTLTVSGKVAAGALLIAAGAYQLTPLKQACLVACRSPAVFLSAHWRPGTAGALRLGVRHGLYCLGCCWLLMALLFVGGVMSLAWVALLAFLVLVEKVAPFGRAAGLAAGGAALLAGAVLLVTAALAH